MQREVLKWLQALDLTFAVKNPQRDFANGFLVAEIIGRYFTGVLSMHTFDPGVCLSARQDNWNQLMKLFQKLNIKISWHLIDEIIHFKVGAAESFVTFLYSLLTQKKAPQSLVNRREPAISSYAKPTAVSKLKDADLDRIVDNDQRQVKALQMIDEHETDLRNSSTPVENPRLLPGGDIGGGGPANLVNRNIKEEARALQESAEVSPLEIKQVQVKTLGASQLRAQQRDQVAAASSNKAPSTTSTTALASSSQRNLDGLASVGSKNVMTVIKSFINPILVKNAPGAAKKEGSFISVCKSSPEVLPENVAVNCLEELVRRVDSLMDVIEKSTASEFWKVWEGVFLPAICDFPESSRIFELSLDLLRLVLAKTSARDVGTCLCIVRDACFGGGIVGGGDVLLGNSFSNSRRNKIVTSLYGGFSPTAESSAGLDVSQKISFLKVLKDACSWPVFLSCLPFCAAVDDPLLMTGERRLADLYLHFSLNAVADPNPRVRAAGLATLNRVCVYGGASRVVPAVSAVVRSLEDGSYWTVAIEATKVLTSLIRAGGGSSNEGVVSLLKEVLIRMQSSGVGQEGCLSEIVRGGALKVIGKEISGLFVRALIFQKGSFRDLILGKVSEEGITTSGTTGNVGRAKVSREWFMPDVLKNLEEWASDDKTRGSPKAVMEIVSLIIRRLEEDEEEVRISEKFLPTTLGTLLVSFGEGDIDLLSDTRLVLKGIIAKGNRSSIEKSLGSPSTGLVSAMVSLVIIEGAGRAKVKSPVLEEILFVDLKYFRSLVNEALEKTKAEVGIDMFARSSLNLLLQS